MKTSAELHLLIRSLNMSEKRHFKIHSSRHVIGEKNNYLHLFDAIAAQEIYDEQAIKKQFDDRTFVKHLPSEKHYLYNHILESLNSFHKEKTFLSRYANILVSVEILYNKGLFNQAKKLISKSKEEAYRLEKFSILLLLLRWETIIYIKDEDEEGLNKNMKEELRILWVMQVQYELMTIAFNIQVQIDKDSATQSYISKQQKLLKATFPLSETSSSFWAKYYYHSAAGLLASVQNKQMTRYHSYKEIKSLMDCSPQFIKDLPGIYHLNSNNLVNVMLLLKKFSEAEVQIKQQRLFLEKHNIKNHTLSRIIFLQTYESELFLNYKSKNFEKGILTVRHIEGEVKKTDNKFSPLLFDLLFMMSVIELMVKNYKGALKWLNRILNAEDQTIFRKELQINSRLLYLVILFESGDLLFESRFKSAKRFLLKENQFKIQQKILKIIGLLAEGKRLEDIKKNIFELKQNFNKSNPEALNKQFDFVSWIENKL